MPLQATSGAASYDAFGGGVAAVPNYIEDVFSTWLYTGNGSTQTINNGIDLLGKGGLVWNKTRNFADNHYLIDTVRGVTQTLFSNERDGQQTKTNVVTAFNSNGFTAGNNVDGYTNASWTFRKQPKFFDVVTWTGNSTARTIAHSLGSVPGCIMVKAYGNMGSIGGSSDWQVYHQSIGNQSRLVLNATTEAINIGSACWNSTTPTDTVFSLGTNSNVNQNSVQYVAYLFAHNAGGFGLTGTDNVISCGSYTGNGSATGPVINLGYESQWVMIKSASASGNWSMFDNMRGVATASAAGNGPDARLLANDSAAEDSGADLISFTSTGFQIANSFSAVNTSGDTYIYIAIRRGPMKVPTDGTKVFAPVAVTNSTGTQNTTNFTLDMQMAGIRSGFGENFIVSSRLTGVSSTTTSSGVYLVTSSTNAEATGENNTRLWDNIGFQTAQKWSGAGMSYWNFRRAPGFFDEVCYTGTGVAGRTVTHNLTVAPELMIVKRRNDFREWNVYAAPLGATKFMFLNTQDAVQTDAMWSNTAPTSSVFTVEDYPGVNASGSTYVAYLFASCPGVSKVGSYTGNGTTQTINCGFTGGARFVLIKRTDAAGGWYVYDTARGMTTLTDPYLLLNSTAAEVATLGSVTTVSTGFALNATILAAINTNAASYIFLAIS